MTYKVELTPPNPDWPAMYQAEAVRLRAVWGEHILDMHHAGSTSIPGIKAKPIIDFLVVVDDTRYVDEVNDRMEALGYEVCLEFGIPGRRFFRRYVDGVRTHNVHVFPAGHSEIARMLDFRDYLRAHPADALAYERLKLELAERYPYDVQTYAMSKNGFVEEILRKARGKPKMSEKPVFQKLQMKPGQRVLIANPPAGYDELLGPVPEGVTRVAQGPAENIQVFAANRAELDAHLPRLKAALAPGGMLWVIYYKGTAKVKTDIHRDTINAYAKSLGLEGVAMVSVSEDLSALRLKVVGTVTRPEGSRH